MPRVIIVSIRYHLEQLLDESGDTCEDLLPLAEPVERHWVIEGQQHSVHLSAISCNAIPSGALIKMALLRLPRIRTDILISLNRQDPGDGLVFMDAINSFTIDDLSIIAH